MKKMDHILYINSIILIVTPVLLFFIFFLKYYIGIPMSILTLYFVFKMINNYSYQEIVISKKYILFLLIVLFLWLYFSGIGNYSFQNIDFNIRNATFRDLIQYPWPVKYNGYGFTYYLAFFLPSALIGKITTYEIGNLFLFLYSYFCMIHIIYLINRYLKNCSYLTILLFIFFSGFDVLCSFSKIFSLDTLEWWNGIMQYSSNTTLLYWCFNQAIPIWMITALLLNIHDSKSILFIVTLSFFYSPYATIGLVPILLYLFFKYSSSIIHDLFSLEVLFGFLVFLILGFYYTSGNGVYVKGLLFSFMNNKIDILFVYLLFIIIEVLFYFILTYRDNKNNILYQIILFELVLIPLFLMSPANDFCMRASIPCLFILMVYFIQYMENYSKKSVFVYFLLLLSFVVPIVEISRSVYYTFTSKATLISDDVVSIGNPKSNQELVERQFYGRLDSFYYQYISK